MICSRIQEYLHTGIWSGIKAALETVKNNDLCILHITCMILAFNGWEMLCITTVSQAYHNPYSEPLSVMPHASSMPIPQTTLEGTRRTSGRGLRRLLMLCFSHQSSSRLPNFAWGLRCQRAYDAGACSGQDTIEVLVDIHEVVGGRAGYGL